MIRYVLGLGLLAVRAALDKPDHTLLWDALFDAGHVPLFGMLALLLRGSFADRPETPSRRRASLRAFGVATLVGAAIETLQSLVPGRDASWIDLARNAAGAAAALLCWHAWSSWRSAGAGARRRVAASAVAALALLAGALFGIADTMLVLWQRSRAAPTLAAFDGSHWERRLVRVGQNRLTPSGDPASVDAPGGMARLDLVPGPYSGLTIDEPHPDWRGYTTLVLPIFSDLDVPLPLTVRIHDARHDNQYRDRFNRRFEIEPGPQTIRIPLDEVRGAPEGREMDMGQIRGVAVFAHRLQQPARLFLGPMRLE